MKTLRNSAIILSIIAVPAVAWAQTAGPDTTPDDSALVLPESSGAQTIEGAPLGNQNVHVHTVQQKPYADMGRSEVSLYPATIQVNARYTRHIGVAATYSYHLFENLALTATPLFNYYNQNTGFSTELLDNGKQQPRAATAMLLDWGMIGGLEITPIYGKFALYDGLLGQFSFVVMAGVGAGSTRIQLKSGDAAGEAAFADVGAKLLGSVGAGFRLMLSKNLALRLEVRDVVYTATVDTINGCTLDELNSPASASVSSSCRRNEIPQETLGVAKSIVQKASSDVINNIQFFGGLSFLF